MWHRGDANSDRACEGVPEVLEMMVAPRYRTDAQACSCPGYWYRRTCKHHRAYCEAVSLVLAQETVNKSYMVQTLHYIG